MSTPADRLARIRRSPAWDGERFRNRLDSPVMSVPDARTLRRFLFERAGRTPPGPLPAVTPVFAPRVTDGLRTTWLGHSTVMLEIEGHRVLTDPVWTDRASPVGYAGPKRFQPVPVSLEALPLPDLVVLSHDHYDHLDRASVIALAKRGAKFVMPLGVGERFEHWGVNPAQVTELDWWEAHEAFPGLTVRALPSRHFSGRSLADRNRTLWAAFAIEGRSHRVFFGGDGGYDEEGFAAIGARVGPFDLTMLEIGAFDVAWAAIHLGPVNAVRAHRLLRGRAFMPIHWGTFDLGLHAWDAPPEELLVATRGTDTKLALPRIGEGFEPRGTLPDAPWWRALSGRTATHDDANRDGDRDENETLATAV